MNLGEKIKELRLKNNMTQDDLASKCYVTRNAVSKWERGLGCPDVSLLGELSEILNVGIAEILNGEFNETLKDNSLFIKNAVDYSKKITEDSIYNKIKKILYVILILITIYMTFMNIRQFMYLNKSIEFKSFNYDATYKEYLRLKENVQIIKEKGYLIHNGDNFTFDYALNLERLILYLDNTKLFQLNTVQIKNTELLNIYYIIHNIHNMDIYCLNRLKMMDSNNSKYYDLAISSQYLNFYSYFIIDENGNYIGDSMYNDNGLEFYYSDKLYYYNEVKDNTELLNDYYKELGIKLNKLNNTLEFIIEAGEINENY